MSATNTDNITKKIKYLGIDFGSSSVSVVGYTDQEKHPIVFCDINNEPWFVTAMTDEDTEDRTVFFKSAYKVSNKTVLDSLKEDVFNGKSRDKVQMFMDKLFSTVKECKNKNAKYNFSELERICFGYPTYTYEAAQQYFCKTVRDIIALSCERVFKKFDVEVTNAPEPVLAAIAYNEAHKDDENYNKEVEDEDLILIVDLGGYTLDIAILQAFKSSDHAISVIPCTSPASVESGRNQIIMGKRITEDICSLIYRDTEGDPPSFDPEVEEQKIIFFKNESRKTDAKPLKVERALKKGDKKIIKRFVLERDQIDESSLVGDTVHVGIYTSVDSRSIFIEETYKNCANKICEYISVNQYDLKNKEISHVIFTGGTSMIANLREKIVNIIKRSRFVSNRVSSDKMCVPSFPRKKDKTEDRDNAVNKNAQRQAVVHAGDDNAFKIKKANDDELVDLYSENIVALGAALYASQPDLNINCSGGKSVTDASNSPYAIYAENERLKVQRSCLELSLLNYVNDQNNFCDDCRKKFLDFLDRFQY